MLLPCSLPESLVSGYWDQILCSWVDFGWISQFTGSTSFCLVDSFSMRESDVSHRYAACGVSRPFSNIAMMMYLCSWEKKTKPDAWAFGLVKRRYDVCSNIRFREKETCVRETIEKAMLYAINRERRIKRSLERRVRLIANRMQRSCFCFKTL